MSETPLPSLTIVRNHLKQLNDLRRFLEQINVGGARKTHEAQPIRIHFYWKS